MMSLLSSSLFPQLPHSLLSYSTPPLLPRRTRRTSTSASTPPLEKVVVIMGSTACGKSKLSIDLAADFFPSAEIINSDKMQFYPGLDITTNKVPLHHRRGVPHHLLGHFHPSSGDFTPSDFRSSASRIISRLDLLPFVVGGSNTYVHALLADKFDPGKDAFAPRKGADSAPLRGKLRYDCCFLWVDVSPRVLTRYVDRRVDDMLAMGMLEEVAGHVAGHVAGLGPGRVDGRGLNLTIGVPEFERYFRGESTYEQAVREVKDNTWRLVEKQVEKIRRLREEAGWEMNRVDNTATVAAALEGEETKEIWREQVLEPSARIVEKFLNN